MAALVDTNVLVYMFDPAHPTKQRQALELIRTHSARDELRIPHQALIEFVPAVTKPRPGARPLLTEEEARTEVESFLATFPIVFPNDAVVRTAIRGAAVYQLSWFDAHLWAYAECLGLPEIYSEDFQHGRLYGTVRALNPFR